MKKIFCLILILLSNYCIGQRENGCEESKCKKAVKLVNKALETFYKSTTNAQSKEAIDMLNDAIALDPDYVDAYYALGRIFFTLNKINGGTPGKKSELYSVEKYYLKVIEICPSFNNEVYSILGDIYIGRADFMLDNANYIDASKNYDLAAKYLKSYLDNFNNSAKKGTKDKLAEYERKLEIAKARSEILNHKVPFTPKCVEGISSRNDECLTIITPDNELALYTRRFPKHGIVDSYIETFTYSDFVNGKFTNGDAMPPPFNKRSNEGGATLTADNLHMYFVISKKITRKVTKKGRDITFDYDNGDIYYSDFVNGQWTEPKNMGDSINGQYSWETQPTVSADGNTLYFVSNRLGGYGTVDPEALNPSEQSTTDIYKIVKGKNGKWSKPINLGPTINTPGDEMTPFIHTDSQTLYFSSNGQDGIGGLDIFYTKQNEKGDWITPKNIGFPINSIEDDMSFFVSTDGKTGYFSSNRKGLGGKGGYDLYSFPLYKEVRPEKVLFVKGQVKAEKSDEPIKAKIDIKTADGKKIKEIAVDSSTGKYVVAMVFKEDLKMTVKQDGFVYDSRFLAKNDSTLSQPKSMDLDIKPIEVGEAYKLNDINFDHNSADLTEGSKKVLNEFIEFLNDQKNLKVSINGHTDNIGGADFNIGLSENRARSVYQYLILSGISPSRLSYHGYGFSKPIASNDTEDGRAKNRRTEFVILSK